MSLKLQNIFRPKVDTALKLPNFLILGANKAGTTSLAYYLNQHPEIFIPKVKEPMFFTSRKQGVPEEKSCIANFYSCFTFDEYLKLFAETDKRCMGEASTSYLANPSCAIWIKKILRDVKLIAILRDPVDRAFSNYKRYHAAGIENRTFEEAITTEAEKGVASLPQGQHYLKLGLYFSQLSVFLKHFDHSQFLITDYESYNNDNNNCLGKIYTFLGVGEFHQTKLDRLNTSEKHYGSNKPQPTLSDTERSICIDFFREDIVKLQTIVNFDVLKWLR